MITILIAAAIVAWLSYGRASRRQSLNSAGRGMRSSGPGWTPRVHCRGDDERHVAKLLNTLVGKVGPGLDRKVIWEVERDPRDDRFYIKASKGRQVARRRLSLDGTPEEVARRCYEEMKRMLKTLRPFAGSSARAFRLRIAAKRSWLTTYRRAS